MCWIMTAGESHCELSSMVKERVDVRIRAGEYTEKDAAYIRDLSRALEGDLTNLPDKRLEQLRSLCQVWDIDLRELDISSHRRVIGPFIIAVKKLCYRILKPLLKDIIRQQRDFNAREIELLAGLCRDIHDGR